MQQNLTQIQETANALAHIDFMKEYEQLVNNANYVNAEPYIKRSYQSQIAKGLWSEIISSLDHATNAKASSSSINKSIQNYASPKKYYIDRISPNESTTFDETLVSYSMIRVISSILCREYNRIRFDKCPNLAEIYKLFVDLYMFERQQTTEQSDRHTMMRIILNCFTVLNITKTGFVDGIYCMAPVWQLHQNIFRDFCNADGVLSFNIDIAVVIKNSAAHVELEKIIAAYEIETTIKEHAPNAYKVLTFTEQMRQRRNKRKTSKTMTSFRKMKRNEIHDKNIVNANERKQPYWINKFVDQIKASDA